MNTSSSETCHHEWINPIPILHVVLNYFNVSYSRSSSIASNPPLHVSPSPNIQTSATPPTQTPHTHTLLHKHATVRTSTAPYSKCTPMNKFCTSTSCPAHLYTCNPHNKHHHPIYIHQLQASRKILRPPSPSANKTRRVRRRTNFEHMCCLALTI